MGVYGGLSALFLLCQKAFSNTLWRCWICSNLFFAHILVKKKGLHMDVYWNWKLFVGILFLLFLAWFFWRREKSRRKICRMSEKEKQMFLNELIAPFGFFYEQGQEVFTSRLDAWQRKEGYEALFDNLASKFNMVLDAFPVYFDYGNKTWMIEFWKGQYGINTGAEVGVYHANRLIPKEQQRKIHYNAVSDEEMPLIGMSLERKGRRLFTGKAYHWWFTAFRMGMFCEPKDLTLRVSVTFCDPAAARAFGNGLLEAGCAKNRFRVKNRRVTVLFDWTQSHAGLEKCYRRLVQRMNCIYCRMYIFVTRPFTRTSDRMLFLYEQLPWCFRHMLRLHAFGRKSRMNHGM